jgi:hypothetical protein
MEALMGRVILFDGGKDGGLYMDSSSTRTIPRFPPPVLAHLRAVCDLLRATPKHPSQAEAANDMAFLITKISNIAVERVEAAIGPLDPVDSLVYLTGDGGFICGSGGAPPRPVTWPPTGNSSIQDLVAGSMLPRDLVAFLRRSTETDLQVTDILEDPVAAARSIDFPLSLAAANSLRKLAPSQLAAVTDPVDRELVGFFHKVIADGRYVDTWASQPVAVATSIGVSLSDAVVDRLLGSNVVAGAVPELANLSIQQGIVVGIIAIAILEQPSQITSVIDHSQTTKF